MEVYRNVSLEFGDFESSLSISYDDCVEFPSSWGLRKSQCNRDIHAEAPGVNENCSSDDFVENITLHEHEEIVNHVVEKEVQTDIKSPDTGLTSFSDEDVKSELQEISSTKVVDPPENSVVLSEGDDNAEIIVNGHKQVENSESDDVQDNVTKDDVAKEKERSEVKNEHKVVNGNIDAEVKPRLVVNKISWAGLFKENTKDKIPLGNIEQTVNGHTETNKQVSESHTQSPSADESDHQPINLVKNDNKPLLSKITPKMDQNAKQLVEALANHDLKFKPQAFIPRGLINSSNWCYINATLQSLMMCPPFFQLFKNLPLSKNQPNTSTPVIDCFVRLASEFQPLSTKKGYQLTKEIRRGPPFTPECVYKMLTSTKSSLSENGSQEDAEEFLACVLNGLHDEMMSLLQLDDSGKTESLQQASERNLTEDKPTLVGNDSEEDDWEEVLKGKRNKSAVTRRADNSTSLVSEIFRGELCTCVGRAGQKLSISREPFFSLPLAVPCHDQFWSVEDALYALTSRESINGSESGKNVVRQQFIEVLPPILILHLKRFVYDKDGGSKKIDRRMDFRSDLIIAKDLLSKSSKKYTLAQRTYKLFAVVCHHGERATGGHYTADVFHIGVSSWLRIDDQKIHAVSHGEVTRHSPTRSPYLLYYRRTDLG